MKTMKSPHIKSAFPGNTMTVEMEPPATDTSGLDHINGSFEWLFDESFSMPKTVRRQECMKSGRKKPVLITGGAGFIGTNLANRLLSEGTPVMIFDNLSRPGVRRNLNWVTNRYNDLVHVRVADIRDFDALLDAVSEACAVYHLAAQVAVTSSIDNPRDDFEINAGGTLNVLEAIRRMDDPPPLVFTSTNKVYGELRDIRLIKRETRYEPEDSIYRAEGIDERCPLDFHSPYGCSKGAADQYILDHARVYGFPAVVFRMSCIYGPHQFGTEDQGWVAHFVINMLTETPIVIYGDGCQVRDILYIDDLVDAMIAATRSIDRIGGRAFNIGGGPMNTASPLEIIDMVETITGKHPEVGFSDWRSADQKFYVSDTGAFTRATGWRPGVDYRRGVKLLAGWLAEHIVPAERQAMS